MSDPRLAFQQMARDIREVQATCETPALKGVLEAHAMTCEASAAELEAAAAERDALRSRVRRLEEQIAPECEPQQTEVEISPEHLARVMKAVESNAALGPSTVAADAVRVFKAIRDKPVITARTHDEQGRRVTDFIELNVSPGLDAVKLAEQIAALLQRATEA